MKMARRGGGQLIPQTLSPSEGKKRHDPDGEATELPFSFLFLTDGDMPGLLAAFRGGAA